MLQSNIPISSVEIKRFEDLFKNDRSFNRLYPLNIQNKAAKHWTPLEVSIVAAEFLAAEKDVHVLDIGSGVGKFCFAAARLKPHAMFYGIEQRKSLVEQAEQCNDKLGFPNVSFIHGNFTQLDFRQFDNFYFYNSFYENLEGTDKIDNSLEYSLSLFNYYNGYLYKELEQKPKGTRVATFHSLEGEIPSTYYTVNTYFGGLLKCWIKV
ncbi:MAG: methyltransferase domain-containing protein [Chitinophagaceae bacterium]|nr:methyltransferase domain-containing protein [Chitinophagaceae bacterium]